MLHDRIFRALNDSGCPYVVVGGLAAVLHGVNRLTHDIDLVVELRPESARSAIQALESLGYRPRVPVPAQHFADADQRTAWVRDKGMQVFSLWDAANNLPTVDLFVEYPVDFDELLAAADLVDLGGYEVRIASIGHLIEMKTRAGRSHDLQDIAALKRLQNAQ
jgi:predicted nucleotidyltransferase